MSKNKAGAETFYYSEGEIKDAIEAVKKFDLSDHLKGLLISALQVVLSVNALLSTNKKLRRTIGRLFGFKSEKKSKSATDSQSGQTEDVRKGKGKGKQKQDQTSGHGRRGHDQIEGAEKIEHPHPDLNSGDPCPEEDCDGKVYPMANPGVYIRVTADEPISTKVHLTEKFRCNLCGMIFEHCPSDIANRNKFDESVLAHIIICKCFYGIAYNRSSRYGPLSASTIAELFALTDGYLKPVFNAIESKLANNDQISFDDTKIKIQPQGKGGSKTAWASAFVGRDFVVYIFDREHAGKSLEKLLKKRSRHLARPILMSDALPSYESYKKDGIDAHCLTHGRRRFKEAIDDDEQYCDELVRLIGKIYGIEEKTKQMDDKTRQEVHVRESGPILNEIMDKVQGAIENESYIPNSELGKALTYWDEHFNKLTQFTRVPGVPLDTNHVERAIKAPIRIRKQAPIFKTEEGARRVGRMLSLLETCHHIGVNSHKYLVWALKGRKRGQAGNELTPWIFKRHLETGRWPPPQSSGREVPLTEARKSARPMATN